MNAAEKHQIKITSYPIGWPTDGRTTRVPSTDGVICIKHPDRNLHIYDTATKKWSEVT